MIKLRVVTLKNKANDLIIRINYVVTDLKKSNDPFIPLIFYLSTPWKLKTV